MSPPVRIVVAQSGIALLMVALWAVADLAAGISSAAAAAAAIIPNAYFAWRVVAANTQDRPLDAARALLGNAVVKVLLSVGMLVVVFSLFHPEPLAFFATFIVVHAVHWIAPLVDPSPRRARNMQGR